MNSLDLTILQDHDEIPVTVEFEYTAAEKGSWNNPDFPEEVEILSVRDAGRSLKLTPEQTDELVRAILLKREELVRESEIERGTDE